MKLIDLIGIYDLTGRTLAAIDNLVENKLDLSTYARGAYMIQIKVDTKTESIKVVKK